MYKRPRSTTFRLTEATVAELIICLSADGGDWLAPQLWAFSKLDSFVSPPIPLQRAKFKYNKLIAKCASADICFNSNSTPYVRMIQASAPGQYRIVVEPSLFTLPFKSLKKLINVLKSQKTGYRLLLQSAEESCLYNPSRQNFWAGICRERDPHTEMTNALQLCEKVIKKLKEIMTYNYLQPSLDAIDEVDEEKDV
jgi:hypothetical protein